MSSFIFKNACACCFSFVVWMASGNPWLGAAGACVMLFVSELVENRPK